MEKVDAFFRLAKEVKLKSSKHGFDISNVEVIQISIGLFDKKTYQKQESIRKRDREILNALPVVFKSKEGLKIVTELGYSESTYYRFIRDNKDVFLVYDRSDKVYRKIT